MTILFARLAAMLERDGKAVLVSVSEVRGSAPRDVGAAMAVSSDGSFAGTIGGGALEWQALAEAQAFLASNAVTTLKSFRKSLGPDLGQCCGGRVSIVLERLSGDDLGWVRALAASPATVSMGVPAPSGHFLRRPADPREQGLLVPGEQRRVLPDGRLVERLGEPATQLLLFGAGHVGRALALAMAPLPFQLHWLDTRPDAFPRFVPQNVEPLVSAKPASRLAEALDGSIVLIMTHSHALDLEIAMAALAAGRFALVGVIGSATKRARFASQMRQAGLSDGSIGRLVCPIGLPGILGKDPATIAASVAAQCLLVRQEVQSNLAKSQDSSHNAPSQGSVDRL